MTARTKEFRPPTTHTIDLAALCDTSDVWLSLKFGHLSHQSMTMRRM